MIHVREGTFQECVDLSSKIPEFNSPYKIEEYKKLHANVWPEVLKNLKDLNCRNYSIFLHKNTLFSYMEYYGDNYERDMGLMSENKKVQEC